jgi:hypothetical protein
VGGVEQGNGSRVGRSFTGFEGSIHDNEGILRLLFSPGKLCSNFWFAGIEMLNLTHDKETNEPKDDGWLARSVDFTQAELSYGVSRSI